MINTARKVFAERSRAFLAVLFAFGLLVMASRAHAQTGLIGWWTFDSSSISGSTAADSSGQGNDAALASSGGNLPQTVSGKINEAIYLSGTSTPPGTQSITVSLSQALSAGSAYTFSFWAENDNPQTSADPFWIEKADDSFFLYFAPTSQIGYGSSLHFSNDYSSYISSTAWHQYAFVLDGSNISLYIDGIFQESKSFSSPSLQTFRIGGLTTFAYKGAMDDVRLYDRALESCEVLDIYNAGNGDNNSSCDTLVQGSLSSPSHSNTSATLSWTAASGGVVPVSTQLQRSPSGANTWSNVGGATASPFTDTGLTTGDSYDYRVVYTDSATSTDTAYSNTVTVTAQFGTTYYIDYGSGSDSSNGLSTSTAWKHAPGMQGCTGACASASPQPGDRFILKGGVTWPNAALGWNWIWMGTQQNPIYIGVDKSWWDPNGTSIDPVTHQNSCGVSTWCRPILDGGLTPLASTSTDNVFLNLGTNNNSYTYAIVDDLEFKGLYFNNYAGTYGADSYIVKVGGVDVTFDNLYIHGWGYPHSDSDTLDSGYGILTGQVDDGSVLENSTIDGWDTYDVQQQGFSQSIDSPPLGTLAAVFGIVHDVHDDVIRNVSNGMVGGFSLVYGNLVEDIRLSRNPSSHGNGVESNSDCNALYYDNVFAHLYGDIVGLWLAPEQGCTDYVFNNVMYDHGPGNILDFGSPCANTFCDGGSVNTFNNTIELGIDSDPVAPPPSCPAPGYDFVYQSCVYDNNFFITNDTSTWSGTSNMTMSNNLIETLADATTQGFTEGGNFAPPSATSPTVGVGANLSSYCPSASQLCFDLNGNARPSVGSWDVGAYQYQFFSTTSPVVVTAAASTGQTSATMNGLITATGGQDATESGFAWGTDPSLVLNVSTTTDGSQVGAGSFSHSLSGLTCNTTYYARAYAANTVGTSSGSIRSFTTSACPTVDSGISGGGGSSSSGGSVSASALAHLLAPSPATTAYLVSLAGRATASCASGDTCTPTVAASSTPFLRNLTLGSYGGDVAALQRYLNGHGFSVAKSGSGSLDHETLYFGLLTQSALAKFQKAHGISPAVGYFGPITRAYISSRQ